MQDQSQTPSQIPNLPVMPAGSPAPVVGNPVNGAGVSSVPPMANNVGGMGVNSALSAAGPTASPATNSNPVMGPNPVARPNPTVGSNPVVNPVLPTVKPMPAGVNPTPAGVKPTPAGVNPVTTSATTSGSTDGQKDAKAAVKSADAATKAAEQTTYIKKIIEKIQASENILVALSRDPSVDEIAAAIGLTLFLDTIQKHVTAIYSGQTPDALQFLQPEGTFETNTDSLRDFIIALSKDKADSLRYKVEGDFVKVYITPYKSMVTEDDLEFSYGDFNVNLVLALGVPTAEDLDGALSEHGRIMHDATIVDITCDAPGNFGEIEWSDPEASSVSEMVTKLIFTMQGKDAKVDKEIATALLTGIVAATGRFSNNRTNSDTMQLASKLMSMGADQQLISAHVMDNDSNNHENAETTEAAQQDGADTEAQQPEAAEAERKAAEVRAQMKSEDVIVQPEVPENLARKATTETVAPAPAPTPVEAKENTVPELLTTQTKAEMAAAAKSAVSEAISAATANAAAAGASGVGVAPAATMNTEMEPSRPAVRMTDEVKPTVPVQTTGKDYAAMLEQALAEPLPVETAASAAGLINNVPPAQPMMQPMTPPMQQQPMAPVADRVEQPEGVVLPPPPPPPMGQMGQTQLTATPGGLTDQTMSVPASTMENNPGAFQIPGMY